MIFSCDKATLLNGLNIASKALPSKSVNPIYEGILFNARNSDIVLTTTDSSLKSYWAILDWGISGKRK